MARDFRHGHVGSEHLLVGLLRQDDTLAAQGLRDAGVDLEIVCRQVAQRVPAGEADVTGKVPFTPRAKRVLELAMREKLSLKTSAVRPEHILLGLLREGESVAVQILRDLGVDFVDLRNWIVWRSRRQAPAAPAPGAELGFHVAQSPELRRLLMSAGAHALADGRTEIEVADLREALRRQDEPPEAQAV